MHGIKPRAAGFGSTYTNNCAMLPPCSSVLWWRVRIWQANAGKVTNHPWLRSTICPWWLELCQWLIVSRGYLARSWSVWPPIGPRQDQYRRSRSGSPMDLEQKLFTGPVLSSPCPNALELMQWTLFPANADLFYKFPGMQGRCEIIFQYLHGKVYVRMFLRYRQIQINVNAVKDLWHYVEIYRALLKLACIYGDLIFHNIFMVPMCV